MLLTGYLREFGKTYRLSRGLRKGPTRTRKIRPGFMSKYIYSPMHEEFSIPLKAIPEASLKLPGFLGNRPQHAPQSILMIS